MVVIWSVCVGTDSAVIRRGQRWAPRRPTLLDRRPRQRTEFVCFVDESEKVCPNTINEMPALDTKEKLIAVVVRGPHLDTTTAPSELCHRPRPSTGPSISSIGSNWLFIGALCEPPHGRATYLNNEISVESQLWRTIRADRWLLGLLLLLRLVVVELVVKLWLLWLPVLA